MFDGDELFDHYRHTLEALDNQKGLLGLIFNKSQNKFDSAHPWASAFGRAARAQIRSLRICQDPAKLRRLIVDLIDKETWVSMSADVKGDAYEGLLEAAPAHPCACGIRTSCPSKNAQDTKSGAGQYSARASCFALPPPSMESFTPAPIIMVGDMLCVSRITVSSSTNIMMMITTMVAIGVMVVREIASLPHQGFNICLICSPKVCIINEI